ncbi:hypothetical protein COEREDRAFT_17820 [Coemansia reversa NRRL 1564]|uniref:Uncharacterized protein n=1 Tax=Coemansia reversa (strain ATCC 12441 / NRRL 1564) TaxID=763665 RepID=A0A2G5B2R9_COERN|nr:hypothetical protein COEREDRAFT_17820 [Coemansia reversa NRRL 1564]|eukprot:PIA13007.1 hypothetical protein COEREDRAFT_17820 [Coemansia reversa NRRL 1564]
MSPYQSQPENEVTGYRQGDVLYSMHDSSRIVLPHYRSSGIGGTSNNYCRSGIGGHIKEHRDTGIGKACIPSRSSSHSSLNIFRSSTPRSRPTSLHDVFFGHTHNKKPIFEL